MLDEYQKIQPIPWTILKREINKNKLAHAYLFESNGYIGTFDLALALAKTLLCPYNYSNNQKCVNCTQCDNIDNGNYPEIKIIEADGMWIKKEQLLELQEQFSTKSVINKRKIYIIKDADKLNNVAANSLLKFIEEPEENIIAILISPTRYQLLDTIVSRCQIISFNQTSLKGNLVEKVAKYLYNTTSAINEFITDEKSIDKINKVIDFVNFYEKNGLDTLFYTYELWTSTFKNKEDLIIAFEILLLYYRDLLNYMCNQELEIFIDYNDNYQKLSENNTINQVCLKIDKIIELKNYLKINANTNLLLDKLILELERS